jgi:DNA-binding XRE family transcriptional regulator
MLRIAAENFMPSDKREPTVREIRAVIATVEVPTTESWRTEMKSRRRLLKISQADLAKKIQVHQTTISDIESGRVQQSIYVPAIALALDMQSPHIVVEDELDARWIQIGRFHRQRNSQLYTFVLDMLEKLLRSAD